MGWDAAGAVGGAESVASYLDNNKYDKILALLPLSFDYGFSQITTCFYVGGEVVLHDFFLANDVLSLIKKQISPSYRVSSLKYLS